MTRSLPSDQDAPMCANLGPEGPNIMCGTSWDDIMVQRYACSHCPLAAKMACLRLAMDAERGKPARERNGRFSGLSGERRAELERAA